MTQLGVQIKVEEKDAVITELEEDLEQKALLTEVLKVY